MNTDLYNFENRAETILRVIDISYRYGYKKLPPGEFLTIQYSLEWQRTQRYLSACV
jgi:hypothetical protein